METTCGGSSMSTPFKPEWLQPGAAVPVDIPTLAAFAEELRRVNQENQALRQALEPEQEPVAWMHTTGTGHVYFRKKPQDKVFNPQPVYTAPPKREWVGLTDGEIDILSCEMVKGYKSVNWLCKVLETKLKEKNHG
jgi:hypothetical protein